MIETADLSKDYHKVKAVQGVSINVRKGEIYGFLGLNGSGKTTTIRMMLGMIRPSRGSVKLFGEKLSYGGQGPWKRIGYLVETPYSYPELTVRENLEAVRLLRGLSDRNSVDEIITKLRLNEYSEVKTETLSLGNNQRLGIAKALIHKPEVLILDEPSNGLDPFGIVEIRKLLHSHAFSNGGTIFISSHNLSEISKIATRIGIIHRGVLIKEIDSAQLNSELKKNLIIGVRDSEGALQVLDANGFSGQMTGEGTILISDSKAVSHPENVNSLLMNAGFPCSLLMTDHENLEDYFLRTIGDAK
jgi:ABC-2 type transport system ATP-binding protein